MLTNKYKRVPCAEIRVDRDARQRTIIDTSDIDDSIKRRGVMNPIIVDRELWLKAGERRLMASIKAGHADIPVRFCEDLSPVENQIIELEENLRRADLNWRDQARAVWKIHTLYSDEALDTNPDADWTQADTAKALGATGAWISEHIQVARELDSPRLAQATSLRGAYNIIARVSDRVAQDLISDIMEAGQDLAKAPEATPTPAPGTLQGPAPIPAPVSRPTITPADQSILNTSFLDWAPQYTGPKFNFIHCDFPYGIEVFGGQWSGRAGGTTYNDSPDVYWALIRCLGANLDRLMTHSGHIMFWFSMEHYESTKAAFREHLPSVVLQDFPLYWLKSDNVGIMPDPKRQPRRIVETAFLGAREDRVLQKSVSNGYPSPTDKSHHTHTKPEPMLRHFFQMFVDEHSRVLDPTCGSGSSLRAAESLGASLVTGLEINSEHCDSARVALRSFRVLRGAK